MTPKKPKTTLPKPRMPRAPKAGPPKKRTKRPTCRRADTFPCGYVCKNQYYTDKKGVTKETQCGDLMKPGQSKDYMSWVKDQTQRIAEINAKRAKKGLAPVETTPALMIDKAKTKKLRPDYQKAKQAEKDAKKEARKAEREAKKAEQGQAPKAPKKPAKEKANISEITKEAKTIEDTAKALSDEQLDAMLKTASFRNSFSGAVIEALKTEKKRRRGGKPEEEEKPEPPKPIRTIKKPTVVDRQDLLPRYRKSFIPEKHKANLSPVQKEGVARAIAGIGRDGQGGFIMADGAGLGKTRQQLAIADYYASQGKKVLIISPNAVIKPDYKTGQVAGSFKDDGAAMDVKFTLSKGDSALEDGSIYLGTYQNIDKFKDLVDKNTVVILDEAHAFKNIDSKRTEHGLKMLDKTGGVLYATATPADKPEHLYYLHRADVYTEGGSSALARHMGIAKITNEDGSVVWGSKSESRKGRKRGNRKGARSNQGGEDKLTLAEREAIAVSSLFDEMTSKGTMMRREISMENVKVNMQEIKIPEEAKIVMEAIEARYAGESKAAARVLLDQRRQLEPFKVPAAIDLVKKAIKKGNQVVVFADRVNESSVYAYDGDDPNRQKVATSEGTIRQLREQLIKAGFDPDDIVELHGGAELKAPDAMNLFQTGKRKIMLTTQGSGGTGINLDDVIGDKPRTLISLTPAFSANEFMQMIGRVWRSQTASIPEIHCLFSDIAIDNWGRGLLASKLVTLGAVVGGSVKDIRTQSFAERLANLRRRNRYNPFLVA